MVPAERAKKLLALHGKLQPQRPTDWAGTFAIPSAVERFYKEVGPVDVTINAHGNPYFVPRLASLWEFQAGYRWNGTGGEPIEGWNDDWLVVANEGGDPFIFSRSSEVIFHAFCGEGVWNASEIFPNLNTMAACLAHLGAIVLEAGDEFTEDDCNIRPECRRLASDHLQELLGTPSSARRVLDRLGWGDI